MTTPPAQPPAQPAPTHTHTPIYANASVLRAVISVCETAAFVVAAIMAALNNGQDFHNAVITALIAFVAHGVNHNAGGSPV